MLHSTKIYIIFVLLKYLKLLIMYNKVLYRPGDDRVVAGVCGGLARYFGLSSALLRIVALFLILFGGLSLWVYIIMWIITPSR